MNQRNNFYRDFCVFVFCAALILLSENLTAAPQAPYSFVHIDSGKKFSQTRSQRKKKERSKKKYKHKMIQKNNAALAPGIWGGKGIGLTVEEIGIKIEFDCADGEIEQKITLDKNGNFAATGGYIPSLGGPIRLDSPPERKPARYEGEISGKKMTLKVIINETNELIGEYVLEQDKFPIIHRCL